MSRMRVKIVREHLRRYHDKPNTFLSKLAREPSLFPPRYLAALGRKTSEMDRKRAVHYFAKAGIRIDLTNPSTIPTKPVQGANREAKAIMEHTQPVFINGKFIGSTTTNMREYENLSRIMENALKEEKELMTRTEYPIVRGILKSITFIGSHELGQLYRCANLLRRIEKRATYHKEIIETIHRIREFFEEYMLIFLKKGTSYSGRTADFAYFRSNVITASKMLDEQLKMHPKKK